MPELTPEMERELTAVDDALAGRPVPSDLADLGELAVALRADRQAPSAAFGDALDTRVRRGFRGPDPRKPASRSFWQLWRTPGVGVAVAAARRPSGREPRHRYPHRRGRRGWAGRR